MSKYLGARFKVKNKMIGTEEIWEVKSCVPSSWCLEEFDEYTLTKQGDDSSTIEVLHKEIEEELSNGRFELMLPPDQDNCWHTWEKYIGFTHVYNVCKTCGKKDNPYARS